jgi:hypothetical protein
LESGRAVELPSPAAFFVALVVSISCSLLVYAHAERNGSRHPTAWGIVGFAFALAGVAVYFGHYFWTRRRR